MAATRPRRWRSAVSPSPGPRTATTTRATARIACARRSGGVHIPRPVAVTDHLIRRARLELRRLPDGCVELDSQAHGRCALVLDTTAAASLGRALTGSYCTGTSLSSPMVAPGGSAASPGMLLRVVLVS